MIFEAVRIEQAEYHILGHTIADESGRRILQKGGRIEADQIALLQSLGCETDYVARGELDDVDENTAALGISHKVAGDGIRLSRVVTGRVSFWQNQPSLKIIVRVPEEVKFSHYLKSNFLG